MASCTTEVALQVASNSTQTNDQEDHLTSVTRPGGAADTSVCNGLGRCAVKTLSTGQHALVSGGATPTSPVLADGLTVHILGLLNRKNDPTESY